jgi:hypothetical protein
MDSLRNAVRAHSQAGEELPLMHSSRCEFLGSLIKARVLEPGPCDVFDEKLVYLFYGRPAYRPRGRSLPGSPNALCPVCFVFKPHTVSGQVARAYPCDSGAVHKDVFEPRLKATDLSRLELDPSIEAVRRYVNLFFSTNGDYYLGRARTLISAGLDDVGRRFHDLLLSKGPSRYDDRRSAVEVQVRTPIDLCQQLLYVVLPREFMDDPDVRTAIYRVWNCEPIWYPTFEGDSPATYYAVLRDRLFERLSASTRI